MKRLLLTILIGLVGLAAFGQFTLEQTITDPGGSTNELFGYRVAVDNDYMVVGTPYADDRDVEAGMAYLYQYDGSSWNLASVLLPNDTVASLKFGYSVAIEGDVIAVGTNSNFNGRVYLFEKGGAMWSDTTAQARVISDPQARWRFGFSVDIAGDFLVAGAPKVTSGGSQLGGEVYVYKKNTGETWAQNAPAVVRRFLTGSTNGSIDGMGYDVKFMKDADQLLILNHSSTNTTGTNGVLRFSGFSNYTSFANIDLRQSPWLQLIASSTQFPSSQPGSLIQYGDSVLLYDQNIYRLDNSGSFNQEGSIEGNIIAPSAGLSAGGDLITGLIDDGNYTQLVCYKKSTSTSWGMNTFSSKVINVSDLPNTPSDPSAYVALPFATSNAKDYQVLLGLGEATSNGTTNAGVVQVYNLDISPQFLGYFPENGATGIKFQSDTVVSAIFDSPISSTSGAFFQYLSSRSDFGSLGIPSSDVTILGDTINLALSESIWIEDYMDLTFLVIGNFTDAYGLTLNIGSNSNTPASIITMGNIAPPSFTSTYTNAENEFARGTFTVDLQANDVIDTVAGNTIAVANASISAITRVNTRKFQFDVTPNFNVGDPDHLNQLTVKIPNTFFVDTAANVALDSIIIEVDYSQSVVRKDGAWLDGVPGNTYEPVLTDNVFIAENYTATSTNLTMNNLIIGDKIAVNLGGEASLDVNGNFVNEGSLYVSDSATVFIRKDFVSGDSVFVKSGASLYTYEGFNHGGKIHAERKNSFGLGKYSFVGSPFEETESNDTDAFGSYIYAYDPTQPYGTDGLAQWVDASAQTIIPGKGYTSSSTDTLKLSGIPNTGTVKVTNLKYEPTSSTYTANLGWQLLSNPFLAPLRVDEMWAANEEALEVEAIYLWDDGGSDQGQRSTSDYLVYNSLGAVGGANGKSFNGMLMPFQAFMIKLRDSNGGGRAAPRIDRSFIFDEDMRAATGGISGNFFRNSEPAKLRLKASDQDGLWSETLIGFTDDATKGFDAKYDAHLRSTKSFSLFSLLEETPMAIQGLPNSALLEPLEIPIGLNVTGEVSIIISELVGLDQINIYFKDNSTGKVTQLSPYVSTSLNLRESNADTYAILLEPFASLSFEDTVIDHLSVWGDQYSINISSGLSGWYDVKIYDLSARERFHQKLFFENGKSAVDQQGLLKGEIYILNLEDQSIKFILK